MFESRFKLGYLKPIFQRAFLNENGLRYDEKLIIGEDYILLACALAKGGNAWSSRRSAMSIISAPARFPACSNFITSRRCAGPMPFSPGPFHGRARRLPHSPGAAAACAEAASFLALVQHIKARSPFKAIWAALSDPAAVRHMGMPIAVRLRRVAAQFAVGRGGRRMRASENGFSWPAIGQVDPLRRNMR